MECVEFSNRLAAVIWWSEKLSKARRNRHTLIRESAPEWEKREQWRLEVIIREEFLKARDSLVKDVNQLIQAATVTTVGGTGRGP
jgi:hypothetical protein